MKWIRNGGTEKDVRDWLDRSGYNGRSARFDELDLVAIQRPGWVQVYVFTVRAFSEESGWTTLLGVVRDDQRDRTDVRLVNDLAERDALREQWSQGLLTRRRRKRHWIEDALLLLFAAVLAFALLGQVFLGT